MTTFEAEINESSFANPRRTSKLPRRVPFSAVDIDLRLNMPDTSIVKFKQATLCSNIKVLEAAASSNTRPDSTQDRALSGSEFSE